MCIPTDIWKLSPPGVPRTLKEVRELDGRLSGLSPNSVPFPSITVTSCKNRCTMMTPMNSSTKPSTKELSSHVTFRWLVMSLFLLNFSAFTITTESFSLRAFRSNGIGVKRKIPGSYSTASKIATNVFRHVGDSSENSVSKEYSSITNKPLRNERKYNVSILVIDHYDSFTYNLCDMIAQLTIDPPTVITKDAMDPGANGTVPFFDKFDGIVLSPGPGTPEEQPPLSHLAITQNPDVPILGVCLGHQLMSLAYGALVDRAPVPIHGQDHRIVQERVGGNRTKNRYPSLFHDLPTSFRVVRYHSLCAYDLPNKLSVTARSKDDVVQAIQHESHPHYGVQFHPESIGTENGLKLLENFLRVVEQRQDELMQEAENDNSGSGSDSFLQSSGSLSPPPSSNPESASRFRIMVHIVSSSTPSLSSLQVFEKYYANQTHSIWLDSSSFHTGRGELDILAAPSRLNDIIEYHINDKKNGDWDILSRLEEELFDGREKDVGSASIIGWVKLEGGQFSLEWIRESESNTLSSDLPFNYRGGFLGFLGYEVRYDTQRYLQQTKGVDKNKEDLGNDTRNRVKNLDDNRGREEEFGIPTAGFFLARQSMVYHHPTAQWYLIGLVEEDSDVEKNIEWMKTVDADMKMLVKNDTPIIKVASASKQRQPQNMHRIEFVPNRPKETYENDIAECHEYIRKGDSYELCLTNQLEAFISSKWVSTFELYKIMREVNPAPYSSYFRWNLPSTSNDHQKLVDSQLPTSMAICSSSPERFMSVSRQKTHPETPSYLRAEAKPIKGTCARVMPENGISLSDAEIREDDRRARSLELSLKNRAENLMIVDLLRNDMSRVCKTGSIHVAKLMDIESFATVHQMVSTIRGTLSASCNAIDLLRASFPGGSMTGAPKIRTMEILEELEEGIDRGAYSGSLGYLSVNGCMDMNIIIRSATVRPSGRKNEWKISVGAGGAITALSDAEDEYDEMLLKARAVKQAVEKWAATIKNDDPVYDTGASQRNLTETIVNSEYL